MSSRAGTIALGLAVLAFAGCGFGPPAGSPSSIETYTLEPGRVILGQPDPKNRLLYELDGDSTPLQVENFVGGGVALVGDMIFAVDGHPAWAYTALASGSNCWEATGTARVDGSFIDVKTAGVETKPGVEIHVRVPKAATFAAATNAAGSLTSSAICVGPDGLAMSAD